MKQLIFVLFLAVAQSATAYPYMEYSGAYLRLVNPDNRSWFCWFIFVDGDERSGVIYPGQASAWRHRDEIIDWGCK